MIAVGDLLVSSNTEHVLRSEIEAEFAVLPRSTGQEAQSTLSGGKDTTGIPKIHSDELSQEGDLPDWIHAGNILASQFLLLVLLLQSVSSNSHQAAGAAPSLLFHLQQACYGQPLDLHHRSTVSHQDRRPSKLSVQNVLSIATKTLTSRDREVSCWTRAISCPMET